MFVNYLYLMFVNYLYLVSYYSVQLPGFIEKKI